MIQPPFDHQLDVLFLERLRQVIVRALLNRLDRAFQRAEGGEHHDGRIRTHAFELPQDRQPIHCAHADIRQHQIDTSLASTRDHRFSAGKGLDMISFLPESLRQQLTRNHIIVSHQNRRWLHHASSLV